jgi:hypothetical protein
MRDLSNQQAKGPRQQTSAWLSVALVLSLSINFLNSVKIASMGGPTKTVREPGLVTAMLDVTADRLRQVEVAVGKGVLQAAHGDIGGDRMGINGYAPIYAKYMPTYLASVPESDICIVEVGILTCSGLAMWRAMFPSTQIYGFDLNTTTCLSTVPLWKERVGFEINDRTAVNAANQDTPSSVMRGVFANALGTENTPVVHLAIDDGYHEPQANLRTFQALRPFLKVPFVYIIEDVYKVHRDNEEKWSKLLVDLKEACGEKCEVQVEAPEDYEGHTPTPSVCIVLALKD